MVKAGFLEKNPAAVLDIPVTPEAQGKNLKSHTVQALFEALPSRGYAGLEDIHPHRGRHTFISDMVENGVDAYLAMELSRQRSLKAYQTYNWLQV
jgi:site-specific recombinase XerD